MDLYFLVAMLGFSDRYEVKICLSYLLFEYIFKFVALKMESSNMCSLIYAYLCRLPKRYLEFAFFFIYSVLF
jgi:hypothetical protein